MSLSSPARLFPRTDDCSATRIHRSRVHVGSRPPPIPPPVVVCYCRDGLRRHAGGAGPGRFRFQVDSAAGAVGARGRSRPPSHSQRSGRATALHANVNRSVYNAHLRKRQRQRVARLEAVRLPDDRRASRRNRSLRGGRASAPKLNVVTRKALHASRHLAPQRPSAAFVHKVDVVVVRLKTLPDLAGLTLSETQARLVVILEIGRNGSLGRAGLAHGDPGGSRPSSPSTSRFAPAGRDASAALDAYVGLLGGTDCLRATRRAHAALREPELAHSAMARPDHFASASTRSTSAGPLRTASTRTPPRSPSCLRNQLSRGGRRRGQGRPALGEGVRCRRERPPARTRPRRRAPRRLRFRPQPIRRSRSPGAGRSTTSASSDTGSTRAWYPPARRHGRRTP